LIISIDAAHEEFRTTVVIEVSECRGAICVRIDIDKGTNSKIIDRQFGCPSVLVVYDGTISRAHREVQISVAVGIE